MGKWRFPKELHQNLSALEQYLPGEFSSFPKEDCEHVLLRSQRLSCEAEMCWEMGLFLCFFFHITQKGFKKSFGSCNQPHISMLRSV